MRIVYFTHSLLSDWNHGNAHFLRGVVTELLHRGHVVDVYEPEDAWSFQNLLAENGPQAWKRFHEVYPALRSHRYHLDSFDLEEAVGGCDLVVVHEWNDPDLVARIGMQAASQTRSAERPLVLFHDTHHRSVTDPASMAMLDLSDYDGVLAFGAVIRDLYLQRGWTKRAWTWHEAADIRVFKPPKVRPELEGDLVWIGNWGDEERTAELEEFLLKPVKDLRLRAKVFGVRYPEHALTALKEAGIEYGGWLPNYQAPQVFARYKVTVHVPRRPYVEALRGIPTIRPFEALACGIPLVSAPWADSEGLFTPGEDYLLARDGEEMCRQLETVLSTPTLARSLAEWGRETILQRHTCAHRVDELLEIVADLSAERRPAHAELRPLGTAVPELQMQATGRTD